MSEAVRMRALLCAALLIAACALPACNLARMHRSACEQRLLRAGYAPRAFAISGAQAADDQVRFAWHRDTGKPKLLLLHGYSGTGALQWSRTAELLREHDCIMPDLLSHGRSAKWDSTRHGHSLDDQAAHIIALLDSLGVDGPIPVVGSSYGGGVAARLAELHPRRISKLVIYDGLVSDYGSGLADSIARAHGAPGMLAVMRTATPNDLKFGIRLSLYRDPPLPGFILKQLHREFAAPYRPAQVALLNDLIAHEGLIARKRYDWRMPVFLIWGERDELIPNATGLAVLRRHNLPDSHWATVPRTGHVANIERPRAFVDTLRLTLRR